MKRDTFTKQKRLSPSDEYLLHKEYGVVFIGEISDTALYEAPGTIPLEFNDVLFRRFGLFRGFVNQPEIPADLEETLHRRFALFPSEIECLVRTVIDNTSGVLGEDIHNLHYLESAESFHRLIPLLLDYVIYKDLEEKDPGDNSVLFHIRHEISLGSGTIEDILTFLLTDMHIKKVEKLAAQKRGERGKK